jgi:hypothetical protein
MGVPLRVRLSAYTAQALATGRYALLSFTRKTLFVLVHAGRVRQLKGLEKLSC